MFTLKINMHIFTQRMSTAAILKEPKFGNLENELNRMDK